MYNSVIKEKFIAELSSNLSRREACLSLFNSLEKYENEQQMDLCAMTPEQLQPVANKMMTIRKTGSRMRMTILQSYFTWCLKNNIPGASDGIFHVELSNVDRLKKSMFANPLMLQQFLNLVFEPESDKCTSMVYRCIYWMAYGGIKIEDVGNITAEHIDFSHMVIRYNDSEYPIYREALNTFHVCAEETQFYYRNPVYVNSGDQWRDRAAGKSIVRGIRQVVDNPEYIRAMMSRVSRESKRNGKTELRPTYYSVFLSGLFYRIYEMEIAGFPPDFSVAADEFVSEGSYSSGRYKQKARSKAIRDYMADYENWKLVFQTL